MKDEPKKKVGRPTNRSRAGRKTIMLPETIQKLEEAFKIGCTDLEACLNADISKSTLYNYQNENPGFLERKELLKESPVFVARKSVIAGLRDDKRLALMYLERKKKDEFSLKTEHEVTGVSLQDVFTGLSADVQQAVKEALKSKLSEKE